MPTEVTSQSSSVIPLQNPEEKHLGFLLTARLPGDFLQAEGYWQGDCIFMALPTESALFDDPAFCVLADHKEMGEHHIDVTNDGSTLSLLAIAPTGERLFVRLPSTGLGTWGTDTDSVETPLGLAVRVQKS